MVLLCNVGLAQTHCVVQAGNTSCLHLLGAGFPDRNHYIWLLIPPSGVLQSYVFLKMTSFMFLDSFEWTFPYILWMIFLFPAAGIVHFLFSFLIFLYSEISLFMILHYMYEHVRTRACWSQCHQVTWNWQYRWSWAAWWRWELNLGPLQEQVLLLTAEPPFTL